MDPYTKLFEVGALIYATFASVNQNRQLDPQEKLNEAEDKFRGLVHDALENRTGTGRVSFGLGSTYTSALTSSIAVKELHDCYFRLCNRQRSGGVTNNGCLCVVYGEQGSGKTSATVALLAMKHSKAPRKAIWLGGGTTFKSGDEYFNSLLDYRVAGGHLILSVAEHGVFAPYGFALFLLEQMKPRASYLEEPLKSGVVDIPGLKDFLKSNRFERTYGGTPVIVLEDVNISLSPRNQSLPEMDQVNLWKGELGKAGVLFDTLITQGHESGVIVFVTTRSLTLATFFSIFNGQQKSCTFKPLISRADFKCQFFNWSKEERIQFLTLQNSLKKPGERINATRIEAIVDDSLAGTTPLNIRGMTANFDDECATEFPIAAASMSLEERLSSWMQCGFFAC